MIPEKSNWQALHLECARPATWPITLGEDLELQIHRNEIEKHLSFGPAPKLLQEDGCEGQGRWLIQQEFANAQQ